MSLTKVTNSMILGADACVFDFMSPAEIADVKARTYSLDVSAAITTAIASSE